MAGCPCCASTLIHLLIHDAEVAEGVCRGCGAEWQEFKGHVWVLNSDDVAHGPKLGGSWMLYQMIGETVSDSRRVYTFRSSDGQTITRTCDSALSPFSMGSSYTLEEIERQTEALGTEISPSVPV